MSTTPSLNHGERWTLDRRRRNRVRVVETPKEKRFKLLAEPNEKSSRGSRLPEVAVVDRAVPADAAYAVAKLWAAARSTLGAQDMGQPTFTLNMRGAKGEIILSAARPEGRRSFPARTSGLLVDNVDDPACWEKTARECIAGMADRYSN